MEDLLGPSSICMICDSNISKSIKVRDMTSQTDCVFCLECLVKGRTKEGLDHRADCDYFIYDSLKFPLISPNWSAQETLRLIQGIMKCGMGNWSAVASEFVKTKSESECEEFYLGVLYIPGNKQISYDHVLIERDFSGGNNDKFNTKAV